MKNLVFSVCFAVVLAAALTVSNLCVSPPALSINDLHAAWVIGGHDYFVRQGESLTTNPELVILDNKSVTFAAHKPTGVFRVFCVGGSTTQGWPFHHKASYPLMLSLMLKDLLPSSHFEIINAGFLASDSFGDQTLVRELMEYQPDLLIIYEGRNEYWNLPLHIGIRSTLLKMHFWLARHLRLYGWITARLSQRGSGFNHAMAIRSWAGYSHRMDPSQFKHLFQQNMDSIIGTAKTHHCRVLLLSQIISPEENKPTLNIGILNDWIREEAAHNKIPLADIDAGFRQRGRQNLIIPPPVTHPDLDGYALMARLIAQAMEAQGWPKPGLQWHWNALRSDADYQKELGVDRAFLTETYGRVAKLFMILGKKKSAELYRSRMLRTQ